MFNRHIVAIIKTVIKFTTITHSRVYHNSTLLPVPSGLHEIAAHASTQCIACCQPVRRCSKSFEHKIHKMDSVLNSCEKNLLTDAT